MDEQWAIYGNMKRPSTNDHNNKKLVKSSEKIYMNEDMTHATALSGDGGEKKHVWRAAAVFLALLSVLLLIGLIALVFIFNKRSSDCELEKAQLQTRNQNVTREIDQLHKEYDTMTKDRDDLQRQLQLLTVIKLCKEGITFGNSCYYISTEQKTWEESREDCQGKGADLIIINNEEEQKFVISHNKRLWIGLSDQEEEGVWKWVDGTALNTSYWGPRQPDNQGYQGYEEEDCVLIYLQYYNDLQKWNDLSCLRRNYWICEMTDFN